MQKNLKLGLYSIIDNGVIIGDNVYIGNYVHIRPEVVIGDNTEIRDYCFLGEKCIIGSNCRVYQYANIGSEVTVGDWCYIGAKAIITNDKELKWPKNDPDDWVKQPANIENYVRIGVGAVILPGVTLAKGCRIGAGAVVSHSTEIDKTYIGIPASCIKT